MTARLRHVNALAGEAADQAPATPDSPASPARGGLIGRLAAPPSIHLAIIFLLALALRLLVWRWHELYPLGGDEREYLDQALTLLRERRYVELRLMRPPLYTGFLAACIYLLDSLVQRLRLVQAVVSALTVLPVYALAWEIMRSRRVAAAAALLAALSFTLAANATELLTETLFLFGLAVALWLITRAAGEPSPARRAGPRSLAALAGLALGLLALLRSVALPLVPLAALWLAGGALRRAQTWRQALAALLIVPAAFILVVGPWTARNYAAYGAVILIDTTGAENLWLDNDPAGREAVKAQLYAMGGDMAARQQLATRRGAEAIAADPARFLRKAWGEAQKLLALQFFDDMRARPAIWVPPAEVWLRLALGDGVWLAILFGGVMGLWTWRGGGRPLDPRWLLVPWALYVAATALLFHVELRYRLPLYPALLPYAGWALVRVADWAAGLAGRRALGRQRRTGVGGWRGWGAALTCAACLGLMLLHRPYPAEALMLAGKHARLAQAEWALARGDAGAARQAAEAALAADPGSALARLALAEAALQGGDAVGALGDLDAALASVPDHPRAHMLRGMLRRASGDAARADLAYETATLEDAQRWSWAHAPDAPPAALDVGGGLDLGHLRAFYAADEAGFRWTRAESEARLTLPDGASALEIRVASGRPDGVAAPELTVLVDGRAVGRVRPAQGWQLYRFDLPAALPGGGQALVTLRSDTFRPRDLDRASPDGRALGVMVDEIRLVAP